MLCGAHIMTPWPWRRLPPQLEEGRSCRRIQSFRHAAAQRTHPLQAPGRALAASALVHPCKMTSMLWRSTHVTKTSLPE